MDKRLSTAVFLIDLVVVVEVEEADFCRGYLVHEHERARDMQTAAIAQSMAQWLSELGIAQELQGASFYFAVQIRILAFECLEYALGFRIDGERVASRFGHGALEIVEKVTHFFSILEHSSLTRIQRARTAFDTRSYFRSQFDIIFCKFLKFLCELPSGGLHACFTFQQFIVFSLRDGHRGHRHRLYHTAPNALA